MSAAAFGLARDAERLAGLGRSIRDHAAGDLRSAMTAALTQLSVLLGLPGSHGGAGPRREVDQLTTDIAELRALADNDDSPAALMVRGWTAEVADLAARGLDEVAAAEQRAAHAADERAAIERQRDRELRDVVGWRHSWAACASAELARYMADGDHRGATSYVAGLPGRGPEGAHLRLLIGRETGDVARRVTEGESMPAAPDATTISESIEREAARVLDDPSVAAEERRAWLAIRDGWWARSGLGAESIVAHLSVLGARAHRPNRRVGEIGVRQ
jgi:hypothetical protein